MTQQINDLHLFKHCYPIKMIEQIGVVLLSCQRSGWHRWWVVSVLFVLTSRIFTEQGNTGCLGQKDWDVDCLESSGIFRLMFWFLSVLSQTIRVFLELLGWFQWKPYLNHIDMEQCHMRLFSFWPRSVYSLCMYYWWRLKTRSLQTFHLMKYTT